MTEAEWLTIDYFGVVAHARETVCERKARLVACALCREMSLWYADEDHHKALLCIEVAERFADGRASVEELSQAREAIGGESLFEPVFATASADLEQVWNATDGVLSPLCDHYGDDRNLADAMAMDLVHELADLARDIFGNPFRPVTFSAEWRTTTAVAIARTMYESRDFGAMPILADALQDAGCDNADILNHCRGNALHVRGCWVVDLVLGKE